MTKRPPEMSSVAGPGQQVLDGREAPPVGFSADLRDAPKDYALAALAAWANVAQFVSLDARGQTVRTSCIQGSSSVGGGAEALVALLVSRAADSRVNIRTFSRESRSGNPFVTGLSSVDDVMATVRRFADAGLNSIVNESIDIHDGGVSGVAWGAVWEFSPDDTPRCVERPGVAALPEPWARHVLASVYQTPVDLPTIDDLRVEFSFHPKRVGLRRQHSLIWEVSEQASPPPRPPRWPNNFSRLVGDKTYGLLVAESAGLPVPRSFVTPRRLAPFTFGASTGTGEYWTRTAPRQSLPGELPTIPASADIFDLVRMVDPGGEVLAAVLTQEYVDAAYSGAALISPAGEVTIGGVRGTGESFMLGRQRDGVLPKKVRQAVKQTLRYALPLFGPHSLEWVFDGAKVWAVQLRLEFEFSTADVIVPGNPKVFRRFDVRKGLDSLREEIPDAKSKGEGITLVGEVGVTSHFGELLRQHRIPARLERPARNGHQLAIEP